MLICMINNKLQLFSNAETDTNNFVIILLSLWKMQIWRIILTFSFHFIKIQITIGTLPKHTQLYFLKTAQNSSRFAHSEHAYKIFFQNSISLKIVSLHANIIFSTGNSIFILLLSQPSKYIVSNLKDAKIRR